MKFELLHRYLHEMFLYSVCVVRLRIQVHDTVLKVFGLFLYFSTRRSTSDPEVRVSPEKYSMRISV